MNNLIEERCRRIEKEMVRGDTDKIRTYKRFQVSLPTSEDPHMDKSTKSCYIRAQQPPSVTDVLSSGTTSS